MTPDLSLPKPPMLENLLLENPWPLAGALVGIAVVLLLRAVQRRQRGPVVAAVIGVVLAGCVFAAATLVMTDRERITGLTRDLVGSTLPLDEAKFLGMFTPGATLRGPDNTIWLGREGVVSSLDASIIRHGLRGHDIRSIDAHLRTPAIGQTLLRVRTTIGTSASSEQVVPTQWLINWVRSPDGGWRIESVQWLKLYTNEPRMGVWNR